MTLKLECWPRSWPLHEPLMIARGAILDQQSVQVRLIDATGAVGRGEGCGIVYQGETPETMIAQLEAVRPTIERGITRAALLDLLPKGGARMALDAALWDLEAKRDGVDPYRVAGVEARPIASAFTIGIRDLDGYEEAARARSGFSLLKVKVAGDDPVAAVQAVRRGAPGARLIVDANQAWSVDALKAFAPAMAELGVALLEQPIAVGAEDGLDGWTSPVPLCADELVDGVADLDRAAGRFQLVNIKLDKAGGLTAALKLADAVEARGMALMVGCMLGSSLSMAPAMVLAQRCRFVDLDGPMLQSEDHDVGYTYENGRVERPHCPQIWG